MKGLQQPVIKNQYSVFGSMGFGFRNDRMLYTKYRILIPITIY
jgi:hypothetical protein